MTTARVSFQLDEHIPHAVAQALRRRGIDVLTATDAGLLAAADETGLARALMEGRVLVTHDGDFLRLHGRGLSRAGIAYAEHGARTIGQLVTGLVLIYEMLEPHEIAGRVEFL